MQAPTFASPAHPGRVNVLGIGIHEVSMGTAVACIERAILERDKGYVCLTGVHGVMEAQADAELHAILQDAFLNLPDGRPIVWMGRAKGRAGIGQVYGPDLMLETCATGVRHGFRHYLYGGKDGVARELAAALRERVPGVDVVGWRTPPFGPLDAEEKRLLADDVRRAKADVVWVGVSTPKQERLCASLLPMLDARLLIGVGAAYDFLTGRAVDSPRWLRRAGLQWLHRLCQEPRRLGPRYLRNNPRFVWRAAMELVRAWREGS
jgi:N-acetylglucosaminyldiphosphoundecaprenol N-acetyl-beta-D-mannosaminyltransferase